MRRREHVGLTALMDAARLDRPAGAAGISASCSGRASMPAAASAAPISACGCCSSDDPIEAARIAAELDRLNRERQAIEQADAGARPRPRRWPRSASRRRARSWSRPRQGWHPGVVGLVAARLKERFGRPAFAIALEPGGIGTGSGRSITGVDLGSAVRHAVVDGLLLKGGGHAMAAGVTHQRRTRWRRSAPIWKRRSHDAVRAARHEDVAADRRRGLGRAARPSRLLSDDRARRPVRRRQSRAGVRAAGAHRSPMPRRSAGARARAAALRRRHGAVNAIAFRAAGKPLGQALIEATAAARCTPPARSSIDRWNGAERVQLRICDLAPVAGAISVTP